MRKAFTISVPLFFMSLIGCSNEVTHKEAAEELVKIVGVKQKIDKYRDELEQTYPIVKERLTENGLPEEAAKKYIIVITEVARKEYTYENLKNEYIKLYMDSFTVDEIKEIKLFYETTAGRKYLTEIEKILNASMSILDKKTNSIIKKYEPVI